ncbi:MAG: HAMP domain-containing sensor histidine kinase [Thermodesulfobacteriota bacterium]|nr:HAMP domain-containing sensor histidine kinase [Thermodesulfobacteriota bacterium]
MKKRLIVFYWILLLVPTLVVAVFLFQLVSHEQERMNQTIRFSAQERARAIADTLQLTVETVEDELTQTLLRMPSEGLKEALIDLEVSNPLIRNVFVWAKKTGLTYPKPADGITGEERGFTARFLSLFSGRIPWAASSNNLPVLEKGRDLSESIRDVKSERQRLMSLAKGKRDPVAAGVFSPEYRTKPDHGWMPWFMDNSLYILGWVRPDPIGPTYGVELELMTLLSRLVVDFPINTPRGIAYALIDGEGQILHQTGTSFPKPNARPDITAALAPVLPHWSVAVYIVDEQAVFESGRGFVILSGFLIAIFLIAIISGGGLLTWQAHRNMVEARQKTSFVSNVSHELKTPLTSIRMYAELLGEDRVRDEDKARKYLQVIVDESVRLTRLVDNVLDFGRLEQGSKKYHLDDLELSSFIREIIENHGPRVQKAGLGINARNPGQEVHILFDRDVLEQVMLNLVDNAVKYASTGSEIDILLKTEGNHVDIWVCDRGPGIPKKHWKNIFEKFYRVDDSLTAQQPGSGLGLSIARGLLRELNGDLRYEEREGGGSCFIVRIPTT